jgi:hypothetical protein
MTPRRIGWFLSLQDVLLTTTAHIALESQEEDVPKCILFFKRMSCLGQLRPHRRDEAWSSSLWQTFFAIPRSRSSMKTL